MAPPAWFNPYLEAFPYLKVIFGIEEVALYVADRLNVYILLFNGC